MVLTRQGKSSTIRLTMQWLKAAKDGSSSEPLDHHGRSLSEGDGCGFVVEVVVGGGSGVVV